MTCTGIQRLFDAYWDDETTQAEREVVEAHLTACPRCRSLYEQHAHTLEALSALPRIEAAPDLVERVTAGARRIARAPDVMPASPAPVWAPAAAAASVLVIGALVLVPMFQPRPGQMASLERGDLASMRQPELVQVARAPGASGETRTGTGTTPRAGASAGVAAMTDSLFDHSEDVEFILDPVAMRRGSAAASRSVNNVQAERAVISF